MPGLGLATFWTLGSNGFTSLLGRRVSPGPPEPDLLGYGNNYGNNYGENSG